MASFTPSLLTSLSHLWSMQEEWDGLYSLHNVFSLSLLSLHTFPLVQHGPLHVLHSMEYLFFSFSIFSHLDVPSALAHSFFYSPLLYLVWGFFVLFYIRFPRGMLPVVDGSFVSCGGSPGDSLNWKPLTQQSYLEKTWLSFSWKSCYSGFRGKISEACCLSSGHTTMQT